MKKLFITLLGCLFINCSSFANTTIPVDNTLAYWYCGIHQIHLTEHQVTLTGAQHILVIGDSISYGIGADNPNRGFACITSAFIMTYYPNSIYWNASVSGQVSANGITQMNTCPYIPDILIVNFGMNDGAYTSTEIYKTNMEAIVARAKEINPDIKIILCSPIIPATNIYHSNEDVRKFPVMENILFEIKENNTNVFVVPLTSYSAMLINNGCIPANGYTTDSVHPTQTMHQLMAIEVLKVIGLWN